MKESLSNNFKKMKTLLLDKVWIRCKKFLSSPPVWIRRIVVYTLIAALVSLSVTIWNTYHVATNAGWHSIPDGPFKPFVAYPGYVETPRNFWFLSSFILFFCVAYLMASRRWLVFLKVFKFPSRLYLQCVSAGRRGLICLGVGIVTGLVWGYLIEHPPIAGLTGLLILILMASNLSSWFMVILSLVWWKARQFVKRETKEQLIRENNLGLTVFGLVLGLITTFLIGASTPLIYWVAIIAAVAIQLGFDPRVRSTLLLMITSITLLSLLDLLNPTLAMADDAGFYENNMTLDGINNWLDNRDSENLVDASSEGGGGAMTGGLAGGLSGAAAGDADDSDAERAYINMTDENPDDDGLLVIPMDDPFPMTSEPPNGFGVEDDQPTNTADSNSDQPGVEPYRDRPLGEPPTDEES